MVEYKMLNGNRVPMTAADIADRAALDAAWAAGEPDRQAKAARIAGLETEPTVQTLAARLANSTSQQIDDWFAADVHTPGQAIAVLKTVVKVLALKL